MNIEWLRRQLALEIAEINTYEPIDREDVAYNEGKIEGIKYAIGLLNSIEDRS